MQQAQVAQITPDIARVNLPSISTLAFLCITTTFPFLKFWYKQKNECYFQENFINRKQYFEITDLLQRKALELNLPELKPLAQNIHLEFLIDNELLPVLINKLSKSDLIELQNLAKTLGEENNLSPTNEPKTNYPPRTINNLNYEKVSIIDIDKSFENKLIFYYLFQAGIESTEKIAEKLELMTVEQKEKFIEQILQNQPLNKIPQIIYQHPFCTMRLFCPLYELLPLINSNKNKIVIKRPVLTSITSIDNKITTEKNYNKVLEILSIVKDYYDLENNPYIIPTIINQVAIISLDLEGINEVLKIENNLSQKIISALGKEIPFTKCFHQEQQYEQTR